MRALLLTAILLLGPTVVRASVPNMADPDLLASFPSTEWAFVENGDAKYAGIAGAAGYLYLWCIEGVFGLTFLNAVADAPPAIVDLADQPEPVQMSLALEGTDRLVVPSAVVREGRYILTMKFNVVDLVVSLIRKSSNVMVWTALTPEAAALDEYQAQFSARGSSKTIGLVQSACGR